MRGYWGRPDLDGRGFRYRPSPGGGRDRFYRTGDLVSDPGDGELRFHGRKDRQAKSRGNRVELDEVEGALYRHDAVEEAAVVLVENGEGSHDISAGVTLVPGATATGGELRKFLSTELPTYAVPGSIVALERLPRTGSDKIDRPALARMLAPNDGVTHGEL